MRALLPSLLFGLFSCAGVDEAPRIAKVEQGVLIFGDAGTRAKGTTLLAHLGSVIVSCPDGGYAAGAPGDDSVWISPPRVRVPVQRGSLLAVDPFPLACLSLNNTLRVLVGGPSNAYAVLTDGGSVQLLNSRVDSFDSAPGAFLAVGGSGVIQTYPNSSAASALTNPTFSTMTAVNGLGNSVSWSQAGELLAGNLIARSAGFYPADTSGDGGRLFIAPIYLPNPDSTAGGTDFGRVVLIGDVTPDVGEENVVAAPALGKVYVFSGTRLVSILRGGTSFGASLALEPTSLGGIHALWIGEPGQDRVWRYVGAQGEVFPAPPEGVNGSFGAAIAVDSRGLVAIGAPRFNESVLLEVGAVFEAFFDGGSPAGVAGPCDAGESCVLPYCNTGVGVGDVFCQQTRPAGSNCVGGQRCDLNANVCVVDTTTDAGPDASVDAGIPDAGVADAGIPDAGSVDAGSADAGPMDAGSPDAGPDGGVDREQVFRTCGCTSGGLPLILIALTLTRRSRKSIG